MFQQDRSFNESDVFMLTTRKINKHAPIAEHSDFTEVPNENLAAVHCGHSI